MLKDILKLNGVQKLSKSQQKKFNGGFGPGFCFMRDRNTCCCVLEGTDGTPYCANGRPTGPGNIGCVFG